MRRKFISGIYNCFASSSLFAQHFVLLSAATHLNIALKPATASTHSCKGEIGATVSVHVCSGIPGGTRIIPFGTRIIGVEEEDGGEL